MGRDRRDHRRAARQVPENFAVPDRDDICYASTNRQDALAVVASEADLVLVIGSANSSNSLWSVELARRAGTAAELIDGPDDIRPEWLVEVGVLGLTAGVSAPPHLTGAVLDALGGLGPVSVVERETVNGTMRFTLPAAVRSRRRSPHFSTTSPALPICAG